MIGCPNSKTTPYPEFSEFDSSNWFFFVFFSSFFFPPLPRLPYSASLTTRLSVSSAASDKDMYDGISDVVSCPKCGFSVLTVATKRRRRN